MHAPAWSLQKAKIPFASALYSRKERNFVTKFRYIRRILNLFWLIFGVSKIPKADWPVISAFWHKNCVKKDTFFQTQTQKKVTKIPELSALKKAKKSLKVDSPVTRQVAMVVPKPFPLHFFPKFPSKNSTKFDRLPSEFLRLFICLKIKIFFKARLGRRVCVSSWHKPVPSALFWPLFSHFWPIFAPQKVANFCLDLASKIKKPQTLSLACLPAGFL